MPRYYRSRQAEPTTAGTTPQPTFYALDFVWEFNGSADTLLRTRRPGDTSSERPSDIDRALAYAG